HTGQWPTTPVDFGGKRVAAVGTGSSGVQLIPYIAGDVASLTVYQRTANWCTPLNNAPITPDEQGRLRAEFDAMCKTLDASPSERVTAAGIETTDGSRDFDMIVWATGWDFGTGALTRMGIRGQGGLALEDHWADGPTTFLGIQTTGFPNFFFPGGPHAAAGNN